MQNIRIINAYVACTRAEDRFVEPNMKKIF